MLTHTHTQTSKKKRGKSPQDNVVNVKSVKKKKILPSLGFLFILFLLSPLWKHPATHHLFISYFIQSLFNFFLFTFTSLDYFSISFSLFFFSLSLENSLEKSYSALAWSAGHTNGLKTFHRACYYKHARLSHHIQTFEFCWFYLFNLKLLFELLIHRARIDTFSDFLFASVCVCDWTFII